MTVFGELAGVSSCFLAKRTLSYCLLFPLQDDFVPNARKKQAINSRLKWRKYVSVCVNIVNWNTWVICNSCTCNHWIQIVKGSEFLLILSVDMMNYQLSIACRHLSGNGFGEVAEEQLYRGQRIHKTTLRSIGCIRSSTHLTWQKEDKKQSHLMQHESIYMRSGDVNASGKSSVGLTVWNGCKRVKTG